MQTLALLQQSPSLGAQSSVSSNKGTGKRAQLHKAEFSSMEFHQISSPESLFVSTRTKQERPTRTVEQRANNIRNTTTRNWEIKRVVTGCELDVSLQIRGKCVWCGHQEMFYPARFQTVFSLFQ